MKAIVISGGELHRSFFKEYFDKYGKEACIICVDGALLALEEMGICPEYAVGDFDTLKNEELLEKYRQRGVKILRHNPVKNASDTELAMELCRDAGFLDITLLGALGRRMDHALANLFLLSRYEAENIRLSLLDPWNHIYTKSSSFSIQKDLAWGNYFSLFTLEGPVENVSISGAAYPLRQKKLDSSLYPSLTISNEILEEEARITFSQGRLLVVESRDLPLSP